MKGNKIIGTIICFFLCSSTGYAKEMAFGNVPIKIGGFLSTYGTVTDKEMPYLRFAQATEDPEFGTETILGLQIDAQLSDDIQVVTQMVGDQYQDDFSVNIDWAFLKYQLADDIYLRMGKMAIPAFLYSEYLNVRYAYTWARVPSEVYEMMPVSAYTGVDMLIQLPAGDYTVNIQPFYGNAKLTSPFGAAGEVTTTLEGLIGLTAALETDMQTFRIGYFEGEVSMEDPAVWLTLINLGIVNNAHFPANIPISALLDSIGLSFTSVSYMFNMGNWEFITEWSERTSETNLVSTFHGNFISLAYQIGDYKPYFVWARVDTRNAASRPQEQESISLGVRIELSGGTALKVEWQQADIDTSDGKNRGLFALSATPGSEDISSVNLFSVGFDAVF